MLKREHFLKAADLIEQAPDLSKGSYYHDGCFCTVGALAVACGNAAISRDRRNLIWKDEQSCNYLGWDWNKEELEKTFVDFILKGNTTKLAPYDGDRRGFIQWGWNDQLERTKEEVVRKLREFGSMSDG